MSTFLELCQETARDSGTVSGDASPSNVTGQTGRLLKVVNWVIAAWTSIQNLHGEWRFMQKSFSGETTSGAGKYTASGSFGITDFAEWIGDSPKRRPVSIYLTATGVSDENEIPEIDYDVYRSKYERGSQTNARPVEYAISPANEFCLGPIPDAAYTVKGLYRRTPQVLAANADTPICPARFHRIISRRALMLMAEFDEAPLHIASFRQQHSEILDELRRDQLPKVGIGAGPLA